MVTLIIDPVDSEELFGPRAAQARLYAEFLATVGVERGALGPREAGRVWTRHVRNSLALSPLLPEGASVIDLGSGAGLPGIPLALARPDLDMALLEPMRRRVELLREALLMCEADCRVVHDRAEHTEIRADVVVSRAVAPMSRLIPLARRITRRDGRLLALKGTGAGVELLEARHAGVLNRARGDVEYLTWPDEATVVVVAFGP